MNVSHTPVRAIILKLAATASLAVAIGGATLAAHPAAASAATVPAANHTMSYSPNGDCPWDGEYL